MRFKLILLVNINVKNVFKMGFLTVPQPFFGSTLLTLRKHKVVISVLFLLSVLSKKLIEVFYERKPL